MRSFNTLLGLGLVAFCALALVAEARATVYYVTPGGDDANAGTSGAPFRTIKQAAKVIQSGDTVYVAAGTYTDDVWLNGVQDSSLPATFVGSSGATVNAQWKVVNSNYVHLTGFTFQGGPTRLLVWKGSYEGLIENCQFNNGDEGLLIKDGSLTVDNCLIQDFVHDGIQVDGAADLLVRNSTISGCLEAGIEIRKAARVALSNNCSVDGNLGDGIEVNITTDTIDDGPDLPLIDKKYLSIGLGKFEMSGGFVKGYNSDIGPSSIGNTGVATSNTEVKLGSAYLYGDAYTGGSVDNPAQVTGTITTYTDPLTLPPVDDSYFATNNDNANIPLSDDNKNPLNANLDFTLSGGDGIDLPPGTYYLNKVALSGGSVIRLSGPVVIYSQECDFSGGSVANPAQKPTDCQLYARKDNISFSGSSVFYGTAYAPLGKVNLSGSSTFYGMLAAGEIKSSSSGGIYIDEALLPVAQQIFGGSGASSSPQPTPSWVPISSGEVDISNSTLSNNAHGLRMVTPQACTATSCDFTSNGWGLRLNGSFDLLDCNVSDNTTGGLWLTGLTDADVQVVNLDLTNNVQYGVYAENSQLTFDSGNMPHWAITGSQIAIAGVGSDLTFDTVTISDGATAGVQLTQGTLNATGSTFSGNGSGLAIVDADVTLTGCTLSGNTVGLSANWNATVAVIGTNITNNTSYGITSSYSTLTLSGPTTVSGSSTAALYADGGTLNVSGSTLSTSGYGVWANATDAVVIDTCTLSGNATGLYANQNTSFQVANSTITGSTQWGASVTPKTAGGLTVIFDACTFHSNTGGIALVNAVDGEVSLRTGTLIRDNTNSGLHFENCNLTVNDQAGGTAWRTLRNGYGISSNVSTLTLSSVSVEESGQYGVYCTDSSVSLAGCTVTGVSGVYADAANDSLTVASTRLDATSAGGWGVARYGGDVEVMNSVINGFDGGVFLFTTSGADPAAVNNATLVNLANYGVYLSDGTATVQNTVLVGASSAQGLTQVSGLLTHSYNLLDGFSTPFSGTAADANEWLDNPRLVDAAGGDFRLAKGSPAINSGADLTASGVTIDMLGNTRPSHKVFEIGAYEYWQDGGSLRILNWKEEQ